MKSQSSLNKDKARERHLQRTYGISVDQYERLLEKQISACAVCRRPSGSFRTRLAVDHNHKTGEIRGLLCTHCNRRVIGRHTDPELLQAAADYLRQGTGLFIPVKPKKRKRKRKRK